MRRVAVDRVEPFEDKPSVQLLLADADAHARSLLAALARERVERLAVLEAADGAEAIQIGLQRRPQIALLDVAMPRLGGIEVAITLRELAPQMRLALHTANLFAHRDRARRHRLPLFDKLDHGRAAAWLELQARTCVRLAAPRSAFPDTLGFECSSCGYGVARSTPPERCPMCQREGSWLHTPWRPFSRNQELTC